MIRWLTVLKSEKYYCHCWTIRIPFQCLTVLETYKQIIFPLRLAITLFALACLAGTASFIYYLLSDAVPVLLERNNCSASSYDDVLTSGQALKCLIIEYLPSSVITAVNIVLPTAFSILIVYEVQN